MEDRTSTESINGRIVVFGSSVAYGWAPHFANYMRPYGYEVINKCIGGNKTQDCIDRFYSDVVPLQPDFVIIALSMANEGLPGSSNPGDIYKQYKTNLLKLLKMCAQQRIIACITNVYSNNDYTSTEFGYVRSMNSELESWNIPVFNLLGTLDDLTGHWLPGTSADAGHPNDSSYVQMPYAIPPTTFDRLITNSIKPFGTVGKMAIKYPSSNVVPYPITATPSCSLKSFTASLRVRNVTNSSDHVWLSFDGTTDTLCVTNRENSWHLSGLTNEIDSMIACTDARFTSITISYVPGDGGHARLYIDGNIVGEMAGMLGDVSRIVIGGRADGNLAGIEPYTPLNAEISEFIVYRSRLDDDQIKALYQGQIINQSLEYYCPMDDWLVAPGSRLRNLAMTTEECIINIPGLTVESV